MELKLTIEFPFSTVDRPVVVAVIVNAAFTVEQQTVLTRLLCQGAVGAEEELIAALRMCIGLNAIRLGTVRWSGVS